MKYIRIAKEFAERTLLTTPFINRLYVANKMRKCGDELPMSHGWFPIHMSDIEKAIGDYAPNEAAKDKLIRDIVYCHQRYLTSPSEYFHFCFYSINTSHLQRKTFLAEDMMNLIMINMVGIERCDELEDKYRFYSRLKPFYKREVCRVETEKDYANFLAFINSHSSYFVKPNFSSCGRGCYMVTDHDFSHTHTHTHTARGAYWEFKKLLNDKGCVIEEVIDQHEAMKQWNPSSVQTIRLNTILTNSGFYVFPAALRIGKKNAIVDNAAAGGYVAAVDEKTGIVMTDGVNYKREVYIHPLLQLKGWQVPEWDVLLSMAHEVHSLIPHQKYVGWDFAYTDRGWCVVEANWGEFLTQFVTGSGVRTEFEKRIKE